MLRVPGLTLETARNLTIALIVLFVVGGILSAWLVRKLVAKLLLLSLFALLAFAVWSNRAALEDCADTVAAALEGGATADLDCSVFGLTVEIPAPDNG